MSKGMIEVRSGSAGLLSNDPEMAATALLKQICTLTEQYASFEIPFPPRTKPDPYPDYADSSLVGDCVSWFFNLPGRVYEYVQSKMPETSSQKRERAAKIVVDSIDSALENSFNMLLNANSRNTKLYSRLIDAAEKAGWKDGEIYHNLFTRHNNSKDGLSFYNAVTSLNWSHDRIFKALVRSNPDRMYSMLRLHEATGWDWKYLRQVSRSNGWSNTAFIAGCECYPCDKSRYSHPLEIAEKAGMSDVEIMKAHFGFDTPQAFTVMKNEHRLGEDPFQGIPFEHGRCFKALEAAGVAQSVLIRLPVIYGNSVWNYKMLYDGLNEAGWSNKKIALAAFHANWSRDQFKWFVEGAGISKKIQNNMMDMFPQLALDQYRSVTRGTGASRPNSSTTLAIRS